MVLDLLILLNPWLIVEMWPAYVFSISIKSGRCSSELAQLVPLPFSQGRYTSYSLIDRMIFLSPFRDAARMFMSTDSSLAQLGCGILCL